MVRPPWTTRDVAGGELPVQRVDVAADLEALGRRQRRRVDPRAGDGDHPQAGHALAGVRQRLDHAPQQRPADARAADRRPRRAARRAEAELGAQRRRGRPERGRVEAGDVAGEGVVALRPVADRGRPGPKAAGTSRRGRRRRSSGRAAAGSARRARPSRRCGRRSGTPRARRRPASAGSRRSRSATRTARSCSSGFSCRKWSTSQASSPIQRSNALLAHEVVEDHEVGARGSRPSGGSPGTRAGRARPPRGRCAPPRWRSSALAGWTSRRGRAAPSVTGAWASHSTSRPGTLPAQLVGDGDVAPGVAEPDRRGHEQRALRRGRAPRVQRRARRRRRGATRSTNARISRLTRTGSRPSGAWPGALDAHELAAGQRGEPLGRARRRDPVVGAVDDEHRAADAAAQRLDRLVASPGPSAAVAWRSASRRSVSSPQRDAVLDLLGRVRLGEHSPKKNSRKPR